MTTHSIALLVLATAVLVTPGRTTASTRLAWLTETPPPSATLKTRLKPTDEPRVRLLVSGAAGALAVVVTGLPAGLLVGVAVGATSWWFLRRARQPPATDPMTLAATWDLLAACLRAGLPVPTAIAAVANELPARSAHALKASADLLALGADAATAWTPATACEDTVALARGARRAARSGTALADLVIDLAAAARAGATDAAEAAAQRAGVLITAPLGLCFLPAFVCLGVAPVVAGLAQQISL